MNVLCPADSVSERYIEKVLGFERVDAFYSRSNPIWVSTGFFASVTDLEFVAVHVLVL